MYSWGTIPAYNESIPVFGDPGDETTYTKIEENIVPVYNSDGRVILFIEKKDLIPILKSTKGLRELNTPQYHFRDDIIYDLRITTDKGPLHIIVGREKSFWYRSSDDLFKYSIIDSNYLYERLTTISTFL
jgi:hypothetical protein